MSCFLSGATSHESVAEAAHNKGGGGEFCAGAPVGDKVLYVEPLIASTGMNPLLAPKARRLLLWEAGSLENEMAQYQYGQGCYRVSMNWWGTDLASDWYWLHRVSNHACMRLLHCYYIARLLQSKIAHVNCRWMCMEIQYGFFHIICDEFPKVAREQNIVVHGSSSRRNLFKMGCDLLDSNHWGMLNS